LNNTKALATACVCVEDWLRVEMALRRSNYDAHLEDSLELNAGGENWLCIESPRNNVSPFASPFENCVRLRPDGFGESSSKVRQKWKTY
jgi:hypothetical protein